MLRTFAVRYSVDLGNSSICFCCAGIAKARFTNMRCFILRPFRLFRRGKHSLPSASASASASGSGSASYILNDSCNLVLHKGDITKWFIDGRSDAIVNAANELMLGGGGVDGAIHRAAGSKLLKACKEVPEVRPGVRCPTGSARITKGFNLPVSYIIHTVGPIYKSHKESAGVLANSYKSCIEIAKDHSVKYVAFPAISCGVYGYPLAEASKIALETLQSHTSNIEVHFILFGEDAREAWLNTADQLFQKRDCK